MHLNVLCVAVILIGLLGSVHSGCRWDGTAPACAGSCHSDENTMALFTGHPSGLESVLAGLGAGGFGSSCWTGSKAICCKASPGGAICRVDGTAPFCAGKCHSDEREEQQPIIYKFPSVPLYPFPTSTNLGQPCWTGHKRYCCKTATIGRSAQPLMGSRDCAYGPDTCVAGFVWREASPTDHVCVRPDSRTRAKDDNAKAASRTAGGDVCKQGYVWREAFPGDHVCVTVDTRKATAIENYWANTLKACP